MIGNLRLEKDIVLEEISPLSLSKEYNILIPFLLTTVLYWEALYLLEGVVEHVDFLMVSGIQYYF